jgi:integrase
LIDWKEADRFIDGIYRKSRSVHSKHFYSFGIRTLRQFCDEKHVKINQANVYDSLDKFVSWLDSKGLKPKTVTDYTSAAKRFLLFCGLELDDKKLRNRISMPRIMKIAEEPLTIEQVQRILTTGKPNPRMRALILLLLSSGMRLSEALSLRVKDLDLKSKPARATLKAEVTKGKRARVVFMSDEARGAVSEIVEGAPADQSAFNYKGDIWSKTKIATINFRRVVERAGLNELIEGHRIHKIHFHIFRKFFLTKGSDVIGEHAAHALCGHGFYMDTYYQKTEEERAADYLKLMPKLTVFGTGEKAEDKVELNRVVLSKVGGYTKEEIDKLDLPNISDEEIQKMVRERLLGAMASNGGRQRVVPVNEVENHLQQGYDFVSLLPGEKAILKLPF